MISMTKVTTVLGMFLKFNGKDDASLYYEHSDYNDNFFRWTTNTFRHDEDLCVVFNDVSIKVFDRKKVRERLGANLEKITSSPDGVNHGCKFNVVKDLVLILPITEMTKEDFDDIESNERHMREMNEDRRKREEHLKKHRP